MTFEAFWGKARPSSDNGPRMHPLWMHSLDVAAVGAEILRIKTSLSARIADTFGWPVEDFVRLWTFALALHDLGKFSRSFQAKAPDHWPTDVLGPLDSTVRDPGHATSGLYLLAEPLLDFTRERFPGWKPESIFTFLILSLGHHGRPVEVAALSEAELFGQAAIEAAREYAMAAVALFDPPCLPPPPKPALGRGSWVLNGLAVLADWIGSNQTWFPYQSEGRSLSDYWRAHAVPLATEAVRRARLRSATPSSVTGFQTLTGLTGRPTPVQAWADSVALPEGPLLFLIEDMTGGGKTEAALILAHRLMAADRARGLYFALPTMATANAMFKRLGGCFRRLYRSEEEPLLVLSHGRSRDDTRFATHPLGPESSWPAEGATGRNTEETDSALEAPAWLLDDRRKAFLADIGAGTIDQALLSVLPAKHQSLRLLGLAEQVLIIDEAHAYDAYMGTELDRLITFQAALGGHSIVLSATLPVAAKERLVCSYMKACGGSFQQTARADYPCVTLLSPGSAPVLAAKEPRAELRRRIRISRVASEEAALQRIQEAAIEGAAVAWIRNSVDDAIEGYSRAKEMGLDAQLFHARFTFGDRYAIETDVVRRFGKEGNGQGRRGKVLVATQVIEQSLDVDFDLILSDLAPIDLLLQRAGRLWRHPDRLRPIEGPELVVLSPDPRGPVDEKWVTALLPRAGSVYRDHLLLWRGAHVLFQMGDVRVPEDVRFLVEAVYGPDAEAGAPTALARNRQNALGKTQSERCFAEQNLLRIGSGYRLDNQPWLDEARISTRLSEETRTLRLARWDGATLMPWSDDSDPHRAWALSEVTIRERVVSGVPEPTGDLAIEASRIRESWGRYDEDKLLLPLEHDENGNWVGNILDRTRRDQWIEYTPVTGLKFRTIS